MCLLRVLRVFRQRSLLWTNDSSRGVLPSVVRPNECTREASIIRKPWPCRGCCTIKQILKGYCCFEFWVSQSCVVEDSGLLECDAV
jgi:hypothetical protein